MSKLGPPLSKVWLYFDRSDEKVGNNLSHKAARCCACIQHKYNQLVAGDWQRILGAVQQTASTEESLRNQGMITRVSQSLTAGLCQLPWYLHLHPWLAQVHPLFHVLWMSTFLYQCSGSKNLHFLHVLPLIGHLNPLEILKFRNFFMLWIQIL